MRETWKSGGQNTSVLLELGIILSQHLTFNIGESHATLYSIFYKFVFIWNQSRSPFSPESRTIDILQLQLLYSAAAEFK